MRRSTRLLLASFALPALAASCIGEPGDGPLGTAEEEMTICPGASTLKGIDVSGYQPNTDWTKVKNAGFSFAIIKATEGTGYKNPYFDQDWAATKSKGIIRGAYHFFHSNIDPVQQATHFVNTVGALGADDLPLTLDLEVSDGQSDATVVSTALTFLQKVEQLSGKTPLIYISPGFFSGIGSPASFGKYNLWIAHWGVTCPNVPSAWNKLTFWQNADSGSVPGVSGTNVDHDIFNGTMADLLAFANGGVKLPAQVNGNDSISLVNWPTDGHAEAFVVDAKGTMFHAWTKGATDTWNPPAALMGTGQCGFASGFWPPDKSIPELFSPKADGTTEHLWWANGMWNAFTDFGGMGLSHLSTLAWPDGHLEVFALGADQTIWHRSWDVANAKWAAWASLGGGGKMATGVGPITWGDGHAEIFATDDQGIVWHTFSGSGTQFPGGWFKWISIDGTIASRPIPVRWADGHIEAFARSTSDELVHSYYDGGQNKWITWEPISAGTKIQGEPSVIMNVKTTGATAGPEVFARDENGKVVHLWWDGKAFTDFTPLLDQESASDPFGWLRSDGTAEVFAIDPSGVLTHSYRDAMGWSAWAPIGGMSLDACVPTPPGTGGAGGGGTGGGGATASGSTSSGAASGGGGAGGGDTKDGSCSCRAAGSDSTPLGWALLALLPIAARRRRKR
jgi:lysozyme